MRSAYSPDSLGAPMSSRLGTLGLYRHIASTYRSEAGTLLAIAALVFVPLGLLEVGADRLVDVDVASISDLEFAALVAAAAAETGALLFGEVAEREGWRIMRFEKLGRRLAIAGTTVAAAAIGGSGTLLAARRRARKRWGRPVSIRRR